MIGYRVFLSEILQGVWAIEPTALQSYLPVVADILKGTSHAPGAEHLEIEKRKHLPYLLSAATGQGAAPIYVSSGYDLQDAKPGSIAVIPIKGVVTKNDQPCGPSGTNTKTATLQQAFANPNISAVILLVDSPGGQASGVENFADALAGKNKPVICYVDGMMASAAYWMCSGADEIMISQASDIIGSIGAMISLVNEKPALEKMGVEFHEIYATLSTDKNKTYAEALKGNYDPLRKEMLDPLNQAFHKAITQNRAGKIDLEKENVLTGKTYPGKKAIRHGLADSQGSFADAVKRAGALTKKQPINQNKDTNMSIKTRFAAIAAFLGIASLSGDEGKVEMTEAQAEQLQARLADSVAKAEYAAKVAELATTVQSLATVQAELVKVSAKKEKWKTLAKTYGSQPGSMAVAPVSGIDIAVKDAEIPEWQKIHNEELAANKTTLSISTSVNAQTASKTAAKK